MHHPSPKRNDQNHLAAGENYLGYKSPSVAEVHRLVLQLVAEFDPMNWPVENVCRGLRQESIRRVPKIVHVQVLSLESLTVTCVGTSIKRPTNFSAVFVLDDLIVTSGRLAE